MRQFLRQRCGAASDQGGGGLWLFGALWALSVLGLVLSVVAAYRTRTMGIVPEEETGTFDGVRRLARLTSAWLVAPAC